jgi:hypothetical protein
MKDEMGSVEVVVVACHELKKNLDVTVKSALAALQGVNGSVRVVFDGRHDVDELPVSVDADSRNFLLSKDLDTFDATLDDNTTMYSVPWKVSKGVGPCRNWAAESSKADVLIFVDGHMRFPDGMAKHIADHLSEFPKDITCCKMNSVDWDWNGDAVHGGCSLHSFVEEGGKNTARTNRRGVAAKWYKDGGKKSARKIACAMGACYGIRRERYEAIGKPWRILRGWGCAEQTVCVANRLCGGRVWLLDDVVDHMYAAPHHRGVGRSDAGLMSFVNHLAFVYAFCPHDLKTEMETWMLEGKRDFAELKSIGREVANRKADIDAVRDVCGNGKGWGKLVIRKWVGGVSTIAKNKGVAAKRNQGAFRRKLPVAPIDDVSQVVVVRHTKCEMCDAMDSFVAVEGYRDLGVFDQASKRCKVCGHKATFRRV